MVLKMFFSFIIFVHICFIVDAFGFHRVALSRFIGNANHVQGIQRKASATDLSSISPPVENSVAAPIEAQQTKTTEYAPKGTTFCLCSVCKTAYVLPESTLGKKGKLIKCSVCSKEWYQTAERLLKTDDMNYLTELPQEKRNIVKRILADKNIPKYPRTDKVEVFVGNIPYSFQEKELFDLFAQYGIMSLSIARDQLGQSKGFAFLEFATKEDAETASNEMHGFLVDIDRKISVRTAQGHVKSSKQPQQQVESN